MIYQFVIISQSMILWIYLGATVKHLEIAISIEIPVMINMKILDK